MALVMFATLSFGMSMRHSQQENTAVLVRSTKVLSTDLNGVSDIDALENTVAAIVSVNDSRALEQFTAPLASPLITSISPTNPSRSDSFQNVTVVGSGFQPGLSATITFPNGGGTGIFNGSQIQSVTSNSFTLVVRFRVFEHANPAKGACESR